MAIKKVTTVRLTKEEVKMVEQLQQHTKQVREHLNEKYNISTREITVSQSDIISLALRHYYDDLKRQGYDLE